MKLKKLWVALLCAACLIGGNKVMASEALVTMNGRPILTSEEVVNLFDKKINAAFNAESFDTGIAIADLSINDLPITRATVKLVVDDIVKTQAMESIVQEWFKKHKDQESVVAKETLQECQGGLSRAYYEEKECLEEVLPGNRINFFWKKHSSNYSSGITPEESQKIFDTYKKEYGIKIHEDKVNKLVESIVLKWNIQK